MKEKTSETISAAVKLNTLIRTHKPHPRLNEVLDAVRRHNERYQANDSRLDMMKRLRPHPDAEALDAAIRRATVRHQVFVTTLRSLEKVANLETNVHPAVEPAEHEQGVPYVA